MSDRIWNHLMALVQALVLFAALYFRMYEVAGAFVFFDLIFQLLEIEIRHQKARQGMIPWGHNFCRERQRVISWWPWWTRDAMCCGVLQHRWDSLTNSRYQLCLKCGHVIKEGE